MSDNLIKNIVQESAAKPNDLTTHQEGSETIPSGSTPLDSNNGGSALPLACNDEGEEIVRGNEFYKQSFINRGEKLFNNKFDYSKVKYITMRTPVEIICPEHGTFWQRPMDHLRNKFGCPMCAQKYKDKTYKGTLANKKAQIESRITKEEFLTARQSGLSKTYNDKYFELIKTVRDKVYDIYSEKFNMDHFDFIVETKTAEKLSDSSVYVVFYYAYSEEEYDNYEIDDLIELHKGISVDLYNIILEEADYSDLELKMGDLSVAFLLEDEEFNVLYSTMTSGDDVMVLKNNLN